MWQSFHPLAFLPAWPPITSLTHSGVISVSQRGFLCSSRTRCTLQRSLLCSRCAIDFYENSAGGWNEDISLFSPPLSRASSGRINMFISPFDLKWWFSRCQSFPATFDNATLLFFFVSTSSRPQTTSSLNAAAEWDRLYSCSGFQLHFGLNLDRNPPIEYVGFAQYWHKCFSSLMQWLCVLDTFFTSIF